MSTSVDFTRSSLDVDFSGAGITVPRRDGDGRSSAVGAGLSCPSRVGPGLGTSSLNGDGGSPVVVDRIDASWEALVVLVSNGGGPRARGKFLTTLVDGDGCSGT